MPSPCCAQATAVAAAAVAAVVVAVRKFCREVIGSLQPNER